MVPAQYKMKYTLIIIAWLFTTGSQAQVTVPDSWYDHKIQEQVQAVTEVMFHDVVNPPAAARFYAYVALTGYVTLSIGDNALPAFQRSFKNFPGITFDKLWAARSEERRVGKE